MSNISKKDACWDDHEESQCGPTRAGAGIWQTWLSQKARALWEVRGPKRGVPKTKKDKRAEKERTAAKADPPALCPACLNRVECDDRLVVIELGSLQPGSELNGCQGARLS